MRKRLDPVRWLFSGLAIAVLSVPLAAQAQETGDTAGSSRSRLGSPVVSSCVRCHATLGDAFSKIIADFKASVHATVGIGCQNCHGGNPEIEGIEAMSAEEGFKGKPARKDIPDLCASCHANVETMKSFGSQMRTDQLSLYETSQHGVALFQRQDTNVAVCSDCHTAHRILPPRDPTSSVYKENLPDTCARCHADSSLMDEYGIPSTIPEDYRAGYHAYLLFEQGEVAAPVCADCHGSHGATPPGVTNIDRVCATCHLLTAEFFDQSKHARAFPALGIKECVVCHSPHRLERPTEDYFDPASQSACVRCHAPDSPEGETIASIGQTIRQVSQWHSIASDLIKETEEVTHLSMLEMEPKVKEIRTHLLTARAKQHQLDLALVTDEREGAREIYEEVATFAEGLITRSRNMRYMVTLLAVLLGLYGVYIIIWRRKVLDRVFPWLRYRG